MDGRAQGDPEAVGPMLRAARLRQGLSLTAVAALAGVSAEHLGAVERGQYVPSQRTAERLTGGLGLDEREQALLVTARGARRAVHPWRQSLQPRSSAV